MWRLLLAMLLPLSLLFILHSVTARNPVQLVIFGIVLGVLLFIGIVVWAALEANARYRLPRGRTTILAGLYVLCASVVITGWPLRLAIAVSADELNALAQQVEQSNVIIAPQRAGIFTIERAAIHRDGFVILRLDPPGPDRSRGLARHADGWKLVIDD